MVIIRVLGRAFMLFNARSSRIVDAVEIINMFHKELLFGAATVSVYATPTFAQTPTDIDEIILTSTRLGQTANEAGTAISIITSDDIDLLGFDYAVDALASAPGVTINQNGAFGGQASVRIRGASSEQTLVLIDGIAVNDPTSPGGGFNFARLDTANIDRIEVLKGPQSTLWGSDAIGGVVSVTTKKTKEGGSLSGFGEIGSFDTFRGGGSVGAANDIGDFRLAVSAINTDGISKADEVNGNTEEDGYESVTISSRAGLNLGPARLNGSLLYTTGDTEFDSFVFGDQGNVGDGEEVSVTEELSGNISLNVPLLDGRFDNLFLLGYSEIDRENFSNGSSSFDANGDRTTLRYQGTFNINNQHKIAFGVEHEESQNADEETSIDGFFSLYELKPLEGLTLTAGVRLDDHERFGSETTGRLAVAYNVTEHLILRGTWGQGFKAPTIFQTTFFCCGATEPNADLLPETSDGFDVGFDWYSTNQRGKIGVSYFDQSVENLINFSFAIGGYNNIPGADRSGVEVYGNYQLIDWLNISANYTFIDAKDNIGDTLVRVPESSGDVTLHFMPEGPISGAVLVRYNGEEEDSNGVVDDWVRVDLNAAYELNGNVDFFGRIENLLDEDYQQILGYGTLGQSGSIGVRLRY